MLNAIITHKCNTLFLEFPCKRMLLAEHLASIGVLTLAHEIKCVEDEDAPIQVKIYGESEFYSKLASLISPDNTISGVNSFCDMYHNLPYANKREMQVAVMFGDVKNIKEFGQLMMSRRMQDTTEHYYCPLIATVYSRDEYGNMEDSPDEYDGSYLAPYEDRIRELIQREESLDEANLADYFDGSNGAVAKLKEIHFSTQNVDGVLYGDIRVELTEPFTPEEEVEFKEWAIGQMADGWGESFEQREISIPEGELYVSFWNSGSDYFMLNSNEFDEYLAQDQGMGGME